MKLGQITQSYSQALFNLADSKKQLKEVLHDLNQMIEILSKKTIYLRFFLAPNISLEEKIQLLEKIFKDSLNETALTFLKLLLSKGRFNFLTEIVRAFQKKVVESLNILQVKLITAKSVDSTTREKLKKKLQEISHSKNIEIEEKIDHRLIGGGMLIMGSQMIDFSVKSKIERLEKNLLSLYV